MKDAYSFHMSQEDLEDYYQKAYDAYNNIFRRIGMKRFVAVKSDSGMMGGSVAHEYMLLTPIGEDTIVICPECNYMANMEVAVSKKPSNRDQVSQNIEEVFTGDAHEIDEVTKYLGITADKTIKAVAYLIPDTCRLVMAFTRGDLEINEAKLKKAIAKDVVPANLAEFDNVYAGNIGPINFGVKDALIILDDTLKDCNNMVVGANKPEYHIKGVDVLRDIKDATFADISKVKVGDICPICGKPLTIENGIEIGNIFQLGTKYTKAMNMTVLNKDGIAVNPIMGCYGIGVGRAIASVAEESSDERGLIWPMQIAPFHVYLCPLRIDNEEVKAVTDKLYNELKAKGIEVIMDDRATLSPGFKFADCDLMGIPLRVVVSPRSLQNGEVELQERATGEKQMIKVENIIGVLEQLVKSD